MRWTLLGLLIGLVCLGVFGACLALCVVALAEADYTWTALFIALAVSVYALSMSVLSEPKP